MTGHYLSLEGGGGGRVFLGGDHWIVRKGASFSERGSTTMSHANLGEYLALCSFQALGMVSCWYINSDKSQSSQ